MSNKTRSKKNLDKTIVIAIISLIGTIVAALFASPVLIALIGKTPSPPPTETLSPVTPTIATTIIESETPTFIPVQDFSTNCINVTDWTPSPESTSYKKENDCWDLSSKGIIAQNGNLFLAVQNEAPQSGSLYTSPPKVGTIGFTVKIDTFTSGNINGNLVFGVGTVDNWLTQGEFLFFRTTDTGCYIVYGNSVIEVGKETLEKYKFGSEVNILFQFSNLVFDIYVNDSRIASNLPFSPSDTQVFWIGYRVPLNSKLIASISEFHLEQ
jgi:hypothetical protein